MKSPMFRGKTLVLLLTLLWFVTIAGVSLVAITRVAAEERRGYASEPNEAGHTQFTCYVLVRNARNNLPVGGAKIAFNWSWTGEDDYYLEEAWADAEGYAAFSCWDYSGSKYLKVHEVSAPGFITDNTVRSFYIPDLRTQYYYLNPKGARTDEVTHPIQYLIKELWSSEASERQKAAIELIARGRSAIPELMADLKERSYTSDGKYEFPDYPSNAAILEILQEIAKTDPEYLRKDRYVHLIGEAYERGSSRAFRTLAASVLREIGGTQARAVLGETEPKHVARDVVYCPECGRKMQPEWNFCPHDGTRLP